ncbi:MAG: hypothetical protein ABSE49_19630 [Polyangiaceae bacterium]|jgi:hypothetical protein
MLRRISSITALNVALLAGCSAASPAEGTSTTSLAATLSPDCTHGGATTVALVSFDASSLEVEGVTSRGGWIVGRLTPDTVELAANTRAFPPDPIFPQCTQDATTYNQSIGDGLTEALLGDLGQLASDGCEASLVIGADGTVSSFQPVP